VLGHKGGANRYLYAPDPLGSVHHLLDTNQTIVGTYTYWPYGEVVTHTGASTPMQFVGARGYETQIVNRVYAKAGYYRPDLGRWQTVNPIGFEGAWARHEHGHTQPDRYQQSGGRQGKKPRRPPVLPPMPDDVRKSCKGLNPCNNTIGSLSCADCCNALAADSNVKNLLAVLAQYLIPTPVIPSSTLVRCQAACERTCNAHPSGSIAVRDWVECLVGGTASDALQGLVYRWLLGLL